MCNEGLELIASSVLQVACIAVVGKEDFGVVVEVDPRGDVDVDRAAGRIKGETGCIEGVLIAVDVEPETAAGQGRTGGVQRFVKGEREGARGINGGAAIELRSSCISILGESICADGYSEAIGAVAVCILDG